MNHTGSLHIKCVFLSQAGVNAGLVFLYKEFRCPRPSKMSKINLRKKALVPVGIKRC